MVTAMDEAIGNITQVLKAQEMFDNTLILFTADVSIVEALEIKITYNYLHICTKYCKNFIREDFIFA